MKEQREVRRWDNQLEFILTTMGYAIGLGNVWRFPYLVYNNGGLAFLVPYFIMLLLLGLPIFLLETTVGQYTGMNPIVAFKTMVPIFGGVGYAAVFINSVVALFYNLIITLFLYYFVMSMRAELLWKNCKPEKPEYADCFQRTNLTLDCEEEKEQFMQANNLTSVRSPSQIYFKDIVLQLTDSISDLGGMDYPIPLFWLLSWAIILVALIKGIKSLGKISYITSTLPYIMITILVIRTALLEGANNGVKFYVGVFDGSKLADINIWRLATVQAFFSISACCGGLVVMSSYNKFNHNLIRDTFLIPFLDSFTGFYAGFAIFTVLGHMAFDRCLDTLEGVASAGPELAFEVYPEGLSLMGKVAPLFSVLFFLMMLSLGFGTELSCVEITIATVFTMFDWLVTTKMRDYIGRALIVLFYFSIGLLMTTRGGFYILDLLDVAIGDYPFLLVGLFETISIPWFYGSKRLIENLESMVGKKPKWFHYICIALWNFVCPILIATIIIWSFATNNFKSDSDAAVAFYWIISVTPLLICIPYAIYQMFKYKFDWKALLNPLPDLDDNKIKYQEAENNPDVSKSGRSNIVHPLKEKDLDYF